MQTNPQIEVEFSVINPDGTESDMTVELWKSIDGTDYFNTRHDVDWKPLAIDASVIKTLGGAPDQATITLHNLPWIEIFRRDPVAELAKFRDESWRVRIWAWHDDNNSAPQTVRPNVPPVFVGDITEDFGVQSSDIVDSSVQLQATAYGWLSNSGKMKKTWQAGTTYLTMFNDLLAYILSKGYGHELRGSAPKSVIKTDARMNKVLKKKFSMHRNPIETLNDLTRDIDATWGIHNNIPYVIMRDAWFNVFTDDYPSQSAPPTTFYVQNFESGLNSLINYNKHTFSLAAKLSAEQRIGLLVGNEESPQIEEVAFSDRINGRFDEINHSLSNYGNGHQSDMTFRYYDGGKIILPTQRADNSGLNSE